MMQPETLVLLLHIPLSLVYALLVLFGISRLRKEHILPLCLIPVFGLFLALAMEYILRAGRQGVQQPDIESLGLDDGILWATLKSSHEPRDLIPLEEAVLIGEVKIRRRSMLETLYTDPLKYLGVLNTAKNNEDIETSHYATTTISKAQKDFQLAIQQAALEVERRPNDPAVLEAYLDKLGKYLRSGLLEEGLLRNIRLAYSVALDKKIARAPEDKNALIEKLRNSIELGDFNSASEISRLLLKHWPEDELAWIEALRVSVEGKDGEQLEKTIAEMQRRNILWTQQGLEMVRPWLKMAAS